MHDDDDEVLGDDEVAAFRDSFGACRALNLAFGTWQGLYLCEWGDGSAPIEVVATLVDNHPRRRRGRGGRGRGGGGGGGAISSFQDRVGSDRERADHLEALSNGLSDLLILFAILPQWQ